jgi:catechol 2,3-dioxygenase-like lactoylglutathione lyase family enzyme
MRTNGITHLNIRVSDPEESAEFYCETFGMKEAFREMPRAIFLRGRNGFLLTLARGKVPTRKWGMHFGFETKNRRDALAWKTSLKNRGVKIKHERIEESGGGFYFNDPNGYLIEIYYER